MHVLQPPLDFCDNSTDRVGTGLRTVQAERSSAACGKRNPQRLKPPPRLEPNAALKRCSTPNPALAQGACQEKCYTPKASMRRQFCEFAPEGNNINKQYREARGCAL